MVIIILKTSEWLGFVVANTPSLATLADPIDYRVASSESAIVTYHRCSCQLHTMLRLLN